MSFDYNIATKILLIILAIAVLVAIILQFRRKTAKYGGSTKRVKEEFTHPKKQKEKKMPAFSGKPKTKENYEDSPSNDMDTELTNSLPFPKITQPYKGVSKDNNDDDENAYDVKPIEDMDNDDYKAINFEDTNKKPSDCYPRDRLTTDDLLPKDAANSTWAQVTPTGQGDVNNQNYLQAGALIGVDTVGQSLRNANLQLRSDPPIPKIEGLSPWNNSTIEYDHSHRPFEIGST